MPSSDLEARGGAAFNCLWCVHAEGYHTVGRFLPLETHSDHCFLALLLPEVSAHCPLSPCPCPSPTSLLRGLLYALPAL